MQIVTNQFECNKCSKILVNHFFTFLSDPTLYFFFVYILNANSEINILKCTLKLIRKSNRRPLCVILNTSGHHGYTMQGL